MDELPHTNPGIAWVSHPFVQSTKRASFALSAVFASGFFAAWMMESAGFGIIASALLFFSLSKFFFPTRYRLDENGVTVKSTTQTFTRPWKQFRSYYVDPNGVLLSPFAVPSRLENFRGLYVTFKDNKDEVVAYVKAHIKAPKVPDAILSGPPENE